MKARQALSALLVAVLAVPAWAAPPSTGASLQTIGTFAGGEFVKVRNVSALPGTTIFSGDVVDVGARGNAWIALQGGPQVRLGAESRARLVRSANAVEVDVHRGRASFRSTATAAVIGRLGDATVRSASSSDAVGIISIVSADRALIGAEKGSLIVSTAHDARSVTLREGEMVEVAMAPAPVPPPPPAALTGPQVFIIVTIITAAALGIGLKLAAEKGSLTDSQKRNLVSPFTFP